MTGSCNSHQDQDWHLVQAAVDSGAMGIVIAGTGAGSITSPTYPSVYATIQQGIPIVASTKSQYPNNPNPNILPLERLNYYQSLTLCTPLSLLLSFPSQVNNGAVVPDSSSPVISSGYLNPVKSRMQLQLALATGMDMNQTRVAFEGVLAGYLA